MLVWSCKVISSVKLQGLHFFPCLCYLILRMLEALHELTKDGHLNVKYEAEC